MVTNKGDAEMPDLSFEYVGRPRGWWRPVTWSVLPSVVSEWPRCSIAAFEIAELMR